MNRSKIEWTDYSINPVKGLCPVACRDNQGKEYCYAHRMYKRFKWNPEITYDVQPLLDIEKIKQPSRIFVGSTMELFGEWVDAFWLDGIIRTAKDNLCHTFIFLTKQPQNLIKWTFPENCWIGVSVTNQTMHNEAIVALDAIKAPVKFISYEPLLSEISLHSPYDLEGINWVIIGAQTPYSPKTAPKMSWVQEILVAASNAGNIPVFMKNNLQPVLDHDSLWAGWKLRQEFPR